MDDDKIAKLFGDELKPARALAAALNRLDPAMHPELFVSKPEIDLRGRNLDVRFEFHGTFRGKQQWTAWDDRTYDGDESALGSGESKEDALADLIEKLDAKNEPPPRMRLVNLGHPESPPEVVDRPQSDPYEDFDADLEEQP